MKKLRCRVFPKFDGRVGNIKNMYPIEYPNLSICSRFWDTVTIVMEQDSLLFSISTQGSAELFHFFDSWIEALLVSSSTLPSLVLLL